MHACSWCLRACCSDAFMDAWFSSNTRHLCKACEFCDDRLEPNLITTNIIGSILFHHVIFPCIDLYCVVMTHGRLRSDIKKKGLYHIHIEKRNCSFFSFNCIELIPVNNSADLSRAVWRTYMGGTSQLKIHPAGCSLASQPYFVRRKTDWRRGKD